VKRIDNPTPELLEASDVREDPGLGTYEKELRIVAPKDQDRLVISSEISPAIRYIIDHPESEVQWVRIFDGDIVAVRATIPRSFLLLKSQARQSNAWNQVFSNRGNSR